MALTITVRGLEPGQDIREIRVRFHKPAYLVTDAESERTIGFHADYQEDLEPDETGNRGSQA